MGRKNKLVVNNNDNNNDENFHDEEAHSNSDNSDSTKNKKKLNNTKKLPKNSKNKYDDDDDDSDDKVKPVSKNKSHEKQTKKEDNKKAERNIKDQKNDAGPTQMLRKVKLNINPELDVPECYAIYFSQSKDLSIIDKSKIKLLIKIKAKGPNKTTILSWEGTVFTEDEIEDIKKYIKKKYQTSCFHKTVKNSSTLSFLGRKGREFKSYLVDTYGFDNENITISDIKRVIPTNEKKFSVEISIDENQDNLSIVEFKYKGWNDEMFREFIEDFKSAMEKEWSLRVEDEIDHNCKLSIFLRGDNFNEIFTKFFIEECQMTNKQVKIERKLILSKKYSKVNTYKLMQEKFASFAPTSFFKEMEKTIRDTYLYEKRQLMKYKINTDLDFNFVFTDDDNNNYYRIQIDVCNTFSIDGSKLGQGISEGHEVVVEHKKSKATVVGYVAKVQNGLISVLFKLKPNQIPPGSNCLPKGQGQSTDINDYIRANFNEDKQYRNRYQYDEASDDDDEEFGLIDDDDDDDDDDDEIPNNNHGQYKITFQPNNAIYRRSAMSLLILNDIESPIKDIIVNNTESTNKISDETIGDDLIDIENFRLTPTPSQKDCINNILQNHLSLIQGPPGCGKTTSIGFFVYHLLKRNGNDRKRILLCAYSNQAVENMVKVVSPIVKALGKKMVWIPKQAMCFETEEDFIYASEEEKHLSYYKIMNDDKAECAKFKQLQEKRWKFEAEYSKYEERYKLYGDKAVWNSDVPYFSEYDKNIMNNLQLQIEQKYVSESDVVCCTLLQSAKRSVVDFKFEYLFVDEATQVDQVTSLIPLIHQPSRMILLGDHKQLDPFIPEELKRKHPFSTQSLYLYLISKNIRSVMLRTQFRMHPLISEFPNREFYDNQIINADGLDVKNESILNGIQTPILFVNVRGHEQKVFGSSYRNDPESDVVIKLLHNFKMNQVPASQVGVITPYFGQKNLIRSKAAPLGYNDVRISSVDSFQGSERDYIILSLVRSNPQGNVGFLANPNRINVSITRARKGLIVVGNFDSIVNSNANGKNPRNQFLVNMCKFYQEKGVVVDASSIQKVKLVIRVEKPIKAINVEYRGKKIDDDDDNNDGDDDIEYVSD